MKKLYFLASALLAVTTLKAQTTVDFEDLSLPAAVDTFYNGSDEAGGFTSGGVHFGNQYNTTYDSWTGFVYSNMTDNTTSGYMNQYSAYPASGVNGSEIYGIFNGGDTLNFPGTDNDLVSIQLTNTTYAYLSMRDGDSFSKAFGSTTDANGDTDGTNGEDFFFVRIYAHNGMDERIDSVDFYLADYRFTDNNDDYLIDTWTNVDLSNFGGVNYLTFDFHSSDVGQYGINTPTYFALDDIVYTNTSGIVQEKTNAIAVYPNPAHHIVKIENGQSGNYVIVNMQGQTVKTFKHTQETTLDISGLKTGVYFIQNTSLSNVSPQKLIVQ
ncbi:hypothetical protein CW751_04390 [Brumimicrobium salinarum]|uniref:Secretion system C-terminal sorting domain-containing protein n=1 Tax=Brumimicrobium salinarum TaxID=2058658 RepID=A0A2I0R3Z8_9FLAO|nr:DUF4465 domain-containing protein [Brumimicrobium salinarum]PKR81303.1 hypothetical protein CW751_04390 [Brumimicrobium salinarum]